MIDQGGERARLPEPGGQARPRAGAPWRVGGLDWIRAVKWVVVALLAVWLLRLFISWLRSTLM